MTSQERVMAALNHLRPDRIPRYEILFPSFTENWRREKDVPPGADASAHYRIDIPRLLAVQTGPFLSRALPEHQEGGFVVSRDPWGRVVRRLPESGFTETVSTALSEKAHLDQLPFEDPTTPAYIAMVPDVGCPSAASPARVSGTMGLFQSCTWLLGEIPFRVSTRPSASPCRASRPATGSDSR